MHQLLAILYISMENTQFHSLHFNILLIEADDLKRSDYCQTPTDWWFYFNFNWWNQSQCFLLLSIFQESIKSLRSSGLVWFFAWAFLTFCWFSIIKGILWEISDDESKVLLHIYRHEMDVVQVGVVKSSKSPQKLKLVSDHIVTGVVSKGGVLGVKMGGTRDKKGWLSWRHPFFPLVGLTLLQFWWLYLTILNTFT